MKREHLIFDTEIIGLKKPVFLIGVKNHELKTKQFFWFHKRGHMAKLRALLDNPMYTWVGFNSENFDRPIIAASYQGCTADDLKVLAQTIIDDQMRSWQTYRECNIDFMDYDHIDLINVAPGVMISLKTYAGRMGAKLMMDMPFHHDTDLSPAQQKLCETYCGNDLDVTEMLFEQMSVERELRDQLTDEYGIDLRSKSDAQIAEAILKNVCNIRSGDKQVPSWVSYTCPDFVVTNSPAINEVIEMLDEHAFKLNRMNGQPEVPEFLKEPFRINDGTYQMGVGGLHSTHDVNMYVEEGDGYLLSDFDVASYYPNIMMKAGLVPRLGGNKGELFMAAYKAIYDQRMEAKRSGNKKVANSLKITLNGTFGKLGNIYCSFYSPDLLLAVTITGQLNLLCLIHELEKIRGVKVRSANTDGVLVHYPIAARDKVLGVFGKNSKRTGFEYEETPYTKYAAKDVNNYYAVAPAREAAIIEPKTIKVLPAGKAKVKRKGLYAVAGVQEMKNPTMEVCSNAAAEYLEKGTPVETTIMAATDMHDFVSIRNVRGGGVQHTKTVLVDDWTSVAGGWTHPERTSLPVKRKSRPAPREVGVGGVGFGRVARWYMSTKKMPAPTSMMGEVAGIKNGGQIAKSEGGLICMTLPDKLPKDLDYAWYIAEAKAILADCGVKT